MLSIKFHPVNFLSHIAESCFGSCDILGLCQIVICFQWPSNLVNALLCRLSCPLPQWSFAETTHLHSSKPY